MSPLLRGGPLMPAILRGTNVPLIPGLRPAPVAPLGPRVFVPHLNIEVHAPVRPIHILSPSSFLTVAGAPNENAEATKATLAAGAVPAK